jgi:hypothetical protein
MSFYRPGAGRPFYSTPPPEGLAWVPRIDYMLDFLDAIQPSSHRRSFVATDCKNFPSPNRLVSQLHRTPGIQLLVELFRRQSGMHDTFTDTRRLYGCSRVGGKSYLSNTKR